MFTCIHGYAYTSWRRGWIETIITESLAGELTPTRGFGIVGGGRSVDTNGGSALALRVVGDDFDPYQLEGGKKAGGKRGGERGEGAQGEDERDSDYDPWEFLTSSFHDHGHGVTISFRVSPALAGHLDALVASKTVPHYRTRSDVVRDGVAHRLAWLTRMLDLGDDGELAELLERDREQCRLDQAMQAVGALRKLIETAEAQLVEADRSGDEHLREQVRKSLERQVKTMREPYKSQARELLKRCR